MRADEDPVTLIIEIGAFRNLFEILEGVLFRPEEIPVGSHRGQFSRWHDFGKYLRRQRRWISCRTDNPQNEVRYVLQFPAVVLIVLKQSRFDSLATVPVP